jgi:hypothetical protein
MGAKAILKKEALDSPKGRAMTLKMIVNPGLGEPVTM